MSSDDGEDLWSPICAEEVRSVPERNGPAPVADPGIGGGIVADDSGCLQVAQSVCRFADASRHYCWRAGQVGGHRHSVGAAAFRHFAKRISSTSWKRTHDPADGHGSGNVGDTGGRDPPVKI